MEGPFWVRERSLGRPSFASSVALGEKRLRWSGALTTRYLHGFHFEFIAKISPWGAFVRATEKSYSAVLFRGL